MYKAVIIESESGWGTKIDEVRTFETEEDRNQFVDDYNLKHNPNMGTGPVPDWYMIAQRA